MEAKKSPDDVMQLQAEIKRLTKQLETETDAKKEAQDDARAARESAKVVLMSGNVDEVSTGRTVTMSIAKNARAKDPEYDEVEVPTFFYRIDMPPVGGIQIMINGEPMYHGETYELDLHTLRTVKDIVHRLYAHEANIHGSDENAYRPKSPRTVHGARAA
jgi:hypothetical protein